MIEHESIYVRSFDDTSIAVRLYGETDRPPILIVNGIGAGTGMWRFVLPALVGAGRCVAMWDHRGLHGSGPPASDRIDPGAHAEDALAVARQLGWDRFALVAWSTGGRIGVEIATRYPEKVQSLSMICAGAGHPLRRLLRSLEVTPLLPSLAGVAKHFAGPLEGMWRGLVSRPEFTGLVRQSGMIGPSGDVDALVAHCRDLARCDTRTLLAVYEAVVGDPADALLPTLEPRVLLLGGDRDRWTPPSLLEEQARNIPRARLEIYAGATHFLPIEFPERLTEDLLFA